jgi:hypothetical protein
MFVLFAAAIGTCTSEAGSVDHVFGGCVAFTHSGDCNYSSPLYNTSFVDAACPPVLEFSMTNVSEATDVVIGRAVNVGALYPGFIHVNADTPLTVCSAGKCNQQTELGCDRGSGLCRSIEHRLCIGPDPDGKCRPQPSAPAGAGCSLRGVAFPSWICGTVEFVGAPIDREISHSIRKHELAFYTLLGTAIVICGESLHDEHAHLRPSFLTLVCFDCGEGERTVEVCTSGGCTEISGPITAETVRAPTATRAVCALADRCLTNKARATKADCLESIGLCSDLTRAGRRTLEHSARACNIMFEANADSIQATNRDDGHRIDCGSLRAILAHNHAL